MPAMCLHVGLKVEHFGFGCQIDQMGTPVQNHVGEKFGLVNLTILGAGDSDPDGHGLFHQIGEIVTGGIPGNGLLVQVPA